MPFANKDLKLQIWLSDHDECDSGPGQQTLWIRLVNNVFRSEYDLREQLDYLLAGLIPWISIG